VESRAESLASSFLHLSIRLLSQNRKILPKHHLMANYRQYLPRTTNTQPPTAATSAPNMGASIGAQNVGEMLFNEQLLKSGRGDVRVGPMSRWKDFRGNEIVPDNAVDGPN